MASVYTYDDGSQIARNDDGSVTSRDIGSSVWVDDAAPATSGWTVFSSDAAEQAKMGAAYPEGGAWYESAATLGVSRVIDSAARAWATVKGSQPATYAGQNGQTYVNGAPSTGRVFGLPPLVLVAALAALVLLSKKG